MTGSGAYGIVVEVESDTVILELSPGVETRWAKAAIHKLVESDAAAEDEPDDDAVADETGESTDGADGDSSESNSDGR
jgi:preprotein translocase subunit YajC